MNINPMSLRSIHSFMANDHLNAKSDIKEKRVECPGFENGVKDRIDFNKKVLKSHDEMVQESFAKLLETIKRRELEKGSSEDKPLYDFETAGNARQSIVISNDAGVKGCIGENGVVSICDWAVFALWSKADKDPTRFVELLEKNGYKVQTFSRADGPTYAEVFEKMHGMDYFTQDH